MLKKINVFLNILTVSLTGVFAGYVIVACLDYRARPGLYDMQPAPWYTGILVYGVYTILTLSVILFIKFLIHGKLKQQKE